MGFFGRLLRGRVHPTPADAPFVDGERVNEWASGLPGPQVISPLTQTECLAWTTTIDLPRGSDAHGGAALPVAMLRATPGEFAGVGSLLFRGARALAGPSPIREVVRTGGTVFMVETRRGQLELDGRGVRIHGSYMLPRVPSLERKEFLLHQWGLVGTYPVGFGARNPAFDEFFLVPGKVFQLVGTIAMRDGRPTVAPPTIFLG